MGGDDIPAIDEPAIAGLRSAFSLVNDRLVKTHLAGRIAQQQIAAGINAQVLPRPQRGRFNLKSNGARIGARIDYKVVFCNLSRPRTLIVDRAPMNFRPIAIKSFGGFKVNNALSESRSSEYLCPRDKNLTAASAWPWFCSKLRGILP